MKRSIVPMLILIITAGYFVLYPRHRSGDVAAPGATSTGAVTIESVSEPSMSVRPGRILQGDPALVTVEGVGPATTSVRSLTWKGKSLGIFVYKDKPAALIGTDLKESTGTYPLVLTLANGKVTKKDVQVGTRVIAQAPLGIPDSLGGNTPAGEQNVINLLAKENALLASVKTVNAMLWRGDFAYPVENPVVTDTYGYTRLTGASTISHKGTDFRAPVGTPVYAMNSGVVRISRSFIAYGNAVVIDHGFGLQTLYMHLSELDVKEGDMVEKGAFLGKSGQTGYAEGPHLHISVKIGGVSIDPEKFMALF